MGRQVVHPALRQPQGPNRPIHDNGRYVKSKRIASSAPSSSGHAQAEEARGLSQDLVLEPDRPDVLEA